jgi:hypothetical protein
MWPAGGAIFGRCRARLCFASRYSKITRTKIKNQTITFEFAANPLTSFASDKSRFAPVVGYARAGGGSPIGELFEK